MTRKGCHLCDDAKAILLRLRERHPFELHEIDVDQAEETRARYGLEVPVVLIDGRRVAKLRIDEAALLRRLQRSPARERI